MKRLKFILSLLVVLALLSGLFAKELKQKPEISKQEFLFDTLCTITVYSKKDADAINKAFDTAAHLHRLADFYDSGSDVTKINNAKSGVPVVVDADIMNMLILAKEVYDKSDGAFDVTIAPISKLWKFGEEYPLPPDDLEIAKRLPLVGSDKLILDASKMTVTKKEGSMQIDLGGIAKGYAADKAATLLQGLGVKAALIDFGGNIVALGKNPKTENNKWRIGLQTPYAPTGEYSKVIETDGGAVVTSGTYQRYFEYGEAKYHHIIDPKTGAPSVQSYDSVTVFADSAALSDCLATAIFVMGEKSGTELADLYNAKVYFLP